MGGILSYDGVQLRKIELAQPVAWTVMRDRFDHYLVQQAAAAGAGLIEGVQVRDVEQGEKGVRVSTSQGSFTSSLLAGADGVNSQMAKSLDCSPDAARGWRLKLRWVFQL